MASTCKKVFLPKVNHYAHFIDRSKMNRRKAIKSFHHKNVPVTKLPVDSDNDAKCSYPMDCNDSLGCCGESMACHMDNTFTYGQGKSGWKESFFDTTAISSQYEQV